MLSFIPISVITAIIFCVLKKSRDYIKEKYIALRKKMIWNGLIRIVDLGFINYVIWVIRNVEEIKDGSDNEKDKSLYVEAIVISIFLVGFFLLATRVIYSYSNKDLIRKVSAKTFGNLYSDVNLNDTPELNKYTFTLKLILRSFLVLVPMMTTNDVLQIMIV